MPEIIMVRHGEASESFRTSVDPGLSGLGREQAIAVSAQLVALTDYGLFSSPLKRARETAAPLEAAWGRRGAIEPRVAELPSDGVGMDDRGEWLARIMTGTWPEVGARQAEWRSQLIDCLLSANTPRIYFSHFIAINVAVGLATGDDRVICVRPKNTSVFRFSNDGGELRVLALGEQLVED